MSGRFVALRCWHCLPAAALAARIRPAGAELKTYQRDDGQTFFALSLTPPADAAQDQPCDVVILFDTSASQSGAYRDTALAAVEACIAKLRPQDRVQMLAVDLEARPITSEFLAADSDELRAALDIAASAKRRWARPTWNRCCVRRFRDSTQRGPRPGRCCTSATA